MSSQYKSAGSPVARWTFISYVRSSFNNAGAPSQVRAFEAAVNVQRCVVYKL